MKCADSSHHRRSSNKGNTPTVGLLLSAVVGVAFAIFSFERVIAMLAFFFVSDYLLSFISLFLLRRQEPNLPRPYTAYRVLKLISNRAPA